MSCVFLRVAQVREVVQEAGLKPFPDPFIEGFKFDEEGRIVYPGMQVQVRRRETPNYVGHCGESKP